MRLLRAAIPALSITAVTRAFDSGERRLAGFRHAGAPIGARSNGRPGVVRIIALLAGLLLTAVLAGNPSAAGAQGLIGDINGTPTGGVTTENINQWQEYTYTFVPLQATSNLTFTFINGPGFSALDSTTFAGTIGGTGGLTLAGGAETLTGANLYLGATTISGGTLALSGAGSISASSAVNLATGGIFDLSALTNGGTSIVTLGNTVAGQTGSVNLGGNTLTLSNASMTFAGVRRWPTPIHRCPSPAQGLWPPYPRRIR
jgi:hypothetical protein